jgi:hypothetical protein
MFAQFEINFCISHGCRPIPIFFPEFYTDKELLEEKIFNESELEEVRKICPYESDMSKFVDNVDKRTRRYKSIFGYLHKDVLNKQ